MLKTIFWYASGWTFLVLTCPLIWIVECLDHIGRDDARDRWADWVSTRIARVLFSLSGSRVRITGRENIPTEGPVLFVSNHQGHMDSLVIQGYLGMPVGFVSILSVLKYPILRTWMKFTKCVFVDRENARQSLACIDQGVEYLRQGRSMAVFPEGRLNDGGPTGEFRRGWLKLAVRSGVPIVPICIDGTWKALSKSGSRVGSASVECTVLPPVSTAHVKKRDEVEFIQELRASIMACL